METLIKTTIGIGGATASFLFGGWSALIQTLVIFVIIDYIFAVIVAGAHGELNSKIGFKGIVKKITIFVLVAVAHQVDLTLGDGSFVKDAVIFFYIANELLSILETSAKTDLPIPDVLKRAVDVLKQKGDGVNE